MKLYRNISLKEMTTLLDKGKIKGKTYKENKDSDYSKKLGPVVFFFEDAINQTHLFDYDAFLEVDIPKELVKGKGVARYTSKSPCYCCPPTVDKIKEVYVSEYRVEHVTKINIENFSLKKYIDEDKFFEFSVYLLREKYANDYVDLNIDTIKGLDDEVVKGFEECDLFEEDGNKELVNRLLQIKNVLNKIDHINLPVK